MEGAQLKAGRELDNIFDAENKIPNRGALNTPPDLLMKKRTKLTWVEDQTAPPPRVNPDEKCKIREQKLPSTIHTRISIQLVNS